MAAWPASNGSEFFELGGEYKAYNTFLRPSKADAVAEDEEEIRWAAIEQLPSQQIKRFNFALVRMPLLLGTPGSGKSTPLLALAGKLEKSLQKKGTITYSGHITHKLDENVVPRVSAYSSQTDNHIAELTVRKTLDFAARCQGASAGFSEYMKNLACIEKERKICPCPEIDAYMKNLIGGDQVPKKVKNLDDITGAGEIKDFADRKKVRTEKRNNSLVKGFKLSLDNDSDSDCGCCNIL